MILKEFDKNAGHWFKQVVLKDIKSNKSINQKIKELMTTMSQPVSQQCTLGKKISKFFFLMFIDVIILINLIYVKSFT